MSSDTAIFQIVFYIVSPAITFLAVATAYLALHKQSKPSVMLHYEPSNDAGTVIDLVIGNYGGGTARDVCFSVPIPIRCWGVSTPSNVNKDDFLRITIPALAPGKTLRYQAGQYGGLLAQIGEGMPITASYKFKSPLKFELQGEDLSVLDLRYMAQMHSGNSPAYDLADAMKGRNDTIFIHTNRALDSISKSLNVIAASLSAKSDPEK